MTSLSPAPKLQFFASDGTPLAGGKLYTYAAGTMSRIVIAHGVAAWSATPPVVTSGTITNLEIASYM